MGDIGKVVLMRVTTTVPMAVAVAAAVAML